jgi:citrate synthase
MFSSTLKQKMEGLVAARQIEVKDFNKEHGKTVLGEVTVGQVIGGMRGLPAMLYETSKLHPVDGIKYRGMDLFEV